MSPLPTPHGGLSYKVSLSAELFLLLDEVAAEMSLDGVPMTARGALHMLLKRVHNLLVIEHSTVFGFEFVEARKRLNTSGHFASGHATSGMDVTLLHRSPLDGRRKTNSGYVGVYTNGKGFVARGRHLDGKKGEKTLGTYPTADEAAWARLQYYKTNKLPYGELEDALNAPGALLGIEHLPLDSQIAIIVNQSAGHYTIAGLTDDQRRWLTHDPWLTDDHSPRVETRAPEEVAAARLKSETFNEALRQKYLAAHPEITPLPPTTPTLSATAQLAEYHADIELRATERKALRDAKRSKANAKYRAKMKERGGNTEFVHNHATKGLRARGTCPGCDEIYARRFGTSSVPSALTAAATTIASLPPLPEPVPPPVPAAITRLFVDPNDPVAVAEADALVKAEEMRAAMRARGERVPSTKNLMPPYTGKLSPEDIERQNAFLDRQAKLKELDGADPDDDYDYEAEEKEAQRLIAERRANPEGADA